MTFPNATAQRAQAKNPQKVANQDGFSRNSEGLLYRQVFDPELCEIVTQFELTTPDDFRRYLARRPSLSRGLAGLSVGHPVKEPPLDCLARISAASKMEVR